MNLKGRRGQHHSYSVNTNWLNFKTINSVACNGLIESSNTIGWMKNEARQMRMATLFLSLATLGLREEP